MPGRLQQQLRQRRLDGTLPELISGAFMRYLGFAAALLVASAGALAQEPETMAVPENYRQWVFLTSSLDLDYNTAAPRSEHMLDNVFVDPKAFAAFQKTGAWPMGTMLIKENRMAESAGTLSKAGQFQTGVKNLEIHIKDGARFPGKWSFFVSPDGKAPAALRPLSANCYSCHQDHGAVDTTFVQFYPTLMPVAKEKGTVSSSYLKDVN
jgi:hypothetical protein